VTRRSFPGAVVDGALTLARMPADVLLTFADGGRAGAAVGAMVNAADAAARALAGVVTGDEQLKRDASRRREVVEDRHRARNGDAADQEAPGDDDATELRQATDRAQDERRSRAASAGRPAAFGKSGRSFETAARR
jgi:hypothetical protein